MVIFLNIPNFSQINITSRIPHKHRLPALSFSDISRFPKVEMNSHLLRSHRHRHFIIALSHFYLPQQTMISMKAKALCVSEAKPQGHWVAWSWRSKCKYWEEAEQTSEHSLSALDTRGHWQPARISPLLAYCVLRISYLKNGDFRLIVSKFLSSLCSVIYAPVKTICGSTHWALIKYHLSLQSIFLETDSQMGKTV